MKRADRAVIEVAEPDAARLAPIDRATVAGAVNAWLPVELEGADEVRALVVRRLAAELDAGPPPYVVPRLALALVEVVEQIEGTSLRDGRAEVRALLAEVMPR